MFFIIYGVVGFILGMIVPAPRTASWENYSESVRLVGYILAWPLLAPIELISRIW